MLRRVAAGLMLGMLAACTQPELAPGGTGGPPGPDRP